MIIKAFVFFLFLICMFFTHRTYCHKLSVCEKKLHNTSEMLLNLHLCSLQKLSYQSNICVCTGSLIGNQGYKPSPQTKPQSARQQNTYLFTGLPYFSTTDFDMQKIKIHSWILCIKGIFQVQYPRNCIRSIDSICDKLSITTENHLDSFLSLKIHRKKTE